jgi:hypothetical protein
MVLRKGTHPSRKKGFGSTEYLKRSAENKARRQLIETLKKVKEKKGN